MTIKQMINKAKKIYGHVKINDTDGIYVRLQKTDLLLQLEDREGYKIFPLIDNFEFNKTTKELWIN